MLRKTIILPRQARDNHDIWNLIEKEDVSPRFRRWSMASVMYYDRALSEEEVSRNYAASLCLEKETHCP
eukprot:COSAG06_NODE_174_length_21223_cov_8.836158_17_plen_69_part_00